MTELTNEQIEILADHAARQERERVTKLLRARGFTAVHQALGGKGGERAAIQMKSKEKAEPAEHQTPDGITREHLGKAWSYYLSGRTDNLRHVTVAQNYISAARVDAARRERKRIADGIRSEREALAEGAGLSHYRLGEYESLGKVLQIIGGVR